MAIGWGRGGVHCLCRSATENLWFIHCLPVKIQFTKLQILQFKVLYESWLKHYGSKARMSVKCLVIYLRTSLGCRCPILDRIYWLVKKRLLRQKWVLRSGTEIMDLERSFHYVSKQCVYPHVLHLGNIWSYWLPVTIRAEPRPLRSQIQIANLFTSLIRSLEYWWLHLKLWISTVQSDPAVEILQNIDLHIGLWPNWTYN